jgi:predicted phage terminase large subunit-like protein
MNSLAIDPNLFASRVMPQTSLFFFFWKAFEILHPGEGFLPSWHVMAICHALKEVAEGRIRRLLLTVPPRHGKSLSTSVCLPAWILGQKPGLKIISASYGGELALKHARDFRTVLSSGWYKGLYPKTRLQVGGSRLEEQITTAHGGRRAVSLGGAVTGFGADIIIVDDLMKAADASSVVERQRVIDFYQQTLLSRLNDKKEGRIIVIQQRLHEDDLPGHLIESGQFRHLNLPAIAIEDEDIPIGFGMAHHRQKDDVLCPEREPREILNQIRIDMGNYACAAQYGQDPTPPGGNRIRLDWFGQYDASEEPQREDFQFIAQSWDTALTAEPTSDFSVGMTWGFKEDHWYLLDCRRVRMDFPDLKREVLSLANRWTADAVLIEQAGSGISLFQQLRQDDRQAWRYLGTKPLLDKITRVEAQTARLETGRYLLPDQAPWLNELRRELLAFPMGKYDDQVDALTQFVEWASSPRGQARQRYDRGTGRPILVRRQPQRPLRAGLYP